MEIRPKPSIDDVARLAGVSTATVSRSLNSPDRVRPETLQAVNKAIEELGYMPHFGGRALASNKTNTIGAIIPTMDNAIFALGLQALEERLAAAGKTLLVASSGYDPARESSQIRSMLGRGIDGLMLIGEARPEATYAWLARSEVPTVIAWMFRKNCPYPCVGFDNRAGAVKMAELVLDHGHRRIAMIAGISEGNDRASERIEGVRSALSRQGLELAEGHLIEAGYGFSHAAAAMEALMALNPRPTAVVCGNDVLAVGALLHAKKIGLSVPGDLSIVGYDDIDLAAVVDPPLTTLRVPHRRMGDAAASLLLAMSEPNANAEGIEFETEPVIRGSLGPPTVR